MKLNFFVTLIEPISFLLGLFLSIMLYQRYKVKRLPATRNLFLFILFTTLSLLVAAIGRNLFFYESVDSTHPFSVTAYVINLVSLLYLVWFSNLAFDPIKKNLQIFLYVFFVINLISLLFHLITDPNDNDGFWLYHQIPYVIYALTSYGVVMNEAHKSRMQMTDDNLRKGASAIYWAQVSAIFAFISFFADVGYGVIALEDSSEYSIFWFIAYIFILLGVFMSYVGYTLPKWFVSR